MSPSDFIVPGASVVAALITFLGVIIVNRTRKPVETTDLWTRNDNLQKAQDLLRAEFEKYREDKDKEFADYKKEVAGQMDERDRERRAFRHLVAIVSDALDAAWSYVNVLKATMTDAGINAPEPSAYVRMATEAARDIRTGSSLLEEAT